MKITSIAYDSIRDLFIIGNKNVNILVRDRNDIKINLVKEETWQWFSHSLEFAELMLELIRVRGIGNCDQSAFYKH